MRFCKKTSQVDDKEEAKSAKVVLINFRSELLSLQVEPPRKFVTAIVFVHKSNDFLCGTVRSIYKRSILFFDKQISLGFSINVSPQRSGIETKLSEWSDLAI